jgi:MSHA biogenesis protein MshO
MSVAYANPVIPAKKFAQGFTLIELITVIIVLSILAVLGGRFIVESTDSYRSTQTRSLLMNTGRQAIERMTRQLRVSLPSSVRITNNKMCLEFMPIVSGGNYRGTLVGNTYTEYVPDSFNLAAPLNTVIVSPHAIDFGAAQYVSIGAVVPAELYGASPASRATLSSRTNTQLTFTPARGWARNSVNKRFYLLDKPQAFCVVANQLRFYADQDVTAGSVDLNSTFSLLAQNVSGTTMPFALTAGSENRNTVVQLDITFTQAAESLNYNHSVMIRNVP